MRRLDYNKKLIHTLPLLILGVVAWGLTACGNVQAADNEAKAEVAQSDSLGMGIDTAATAPVPVPNPKPAATHFALPEPPKERLGTRDHANYMVTNYWDNFDFHNTNYIGNEKITEAAFETYCQLIRMADATKARQSIHSTLARAHGEPTGAMYGYFVELFERYNPRYFDEIKCTM